MPTNNNNNCRLLATTLAALVVINANSAADVFRITYTGAEGLTLNVRDRYIGGDPHNYSVYQALRMTPREAFDHAERVFGYAATNRNTAGVKRGIATGDWAGTQTPHWKEGDSRAAHGLISSLAALLHAGNGYTVAPARKTARDKAQEILVGLGIANPTGDQLTEVELVLKAWNVGKKLRNDSVHIGGVRFTAATNYLNAITSGGANLGDNSLICRAAGLPDTTDARDFVSFLNRGIRPTTGAFPVVIADCLPSVQAGLMAAAKSYPHGGVLLSSHFSKDTTLKIMDAVAATRGEFYSADASFGPLSVALANQLRNLV